MIHSTINGTEYLWDTAKDVLHNISRYRSLLVRVGTWAGLRHMAKNGVPIQVAMMVRCGYIPKTC